MTPDRSVMRTKGRVIVTRMGQEPQVLLAASAGLGRKTACSLEIEHGRVDTRLLHNPNAKFFGSPTIFQNREFDLGKTLFLDFPPV